MELQKGIKMVSNKCFIDTVCWIGLLNKDDAIHAQADLEYKNLIKSSMRLITTSAVLNEVANALSRPGFRTVVVEFYDRLNKSDLVDIVFIDQKLWDKGWHRYRERLDKGWSLTDCLSMVVMEREKIVSVLTNDHHFEQMGFKVLLK